MAAAYQTAKLTPEGLAVWAEELEDIPDAVLAAAVKVAVAESEYMPTIAKVRRTAAEITRPEEDDIIPEVAWGMVESCKAGETHTLPQIVRDALCAIGGTITGYHDAVDNRRDTASSARARYLDCYRAMQARVHRRQIISPRTRKLIEVAREVAAIPESV